MNDDFGVALGAKAMAKRGEFRDQRLVVVDLAVVDDHHAAVLVIERLLAGRHVDDGQAPVPEAQARLDMEPAFIGAAVMLHLVDARQQVAADVAPSVQIEHSDDSAHDFLSG